MPEHVRNAGTGRPREAPAGGSGSGVAVVLLACVALAAVVQPGGALPAAAQDAIEELRADLQSGRSITRARAARRLGESGHPEALQMLAPAIGDPASGVQREAIDAVLGIVLAPPPAPRDDAPFRTRFGTIAQSVFQAGPLAVLPRAVPEEVFVRLLDATRGDDRNVRASAAFALGVLASPAMGGRPPGVESRLTKDLVYGLQHPDPVTRAALLRAAGRIFQSSGAAAVPVAIGDALIAALNDRDRSVRIAASDALGWVGEARATQALIDRIAYYRKGDEAAASLHALARIAPSTGIATFREYLGHRDAELRVMAIEGLGRARDAQSIQEITRVVDESRQPAIGVAAAFAFYKLGERGNIDRLAAALVVPDVAQQARAYLTELGAAAAADLAPRLQQGDPLVRRAVADVLGLSGDPGVLPALEAATRDADPAVAEAGRQARIRLRALPGGVRTF